MRNVQNAVEARARNLLSPAADLHELSLLAKGYQKELNRIHRTAAGGRVQSLRFSTNRMLSSRRAKICAVLRVVRPTCRMSLSQLRKIADAITPTGLRREFVTLHSKPKPGGGERLITSFGFHRRVYQTICRDILVATIPAQVRDYNSSGGLDALVPQLQARLEEGTWSHVVAVDITNCFGSVRKEDVARLLPLPPWVVRDALLIDDSANVRRSGAQEALRLVPDEAARSGLPQGALTSGLIMSRAILGPALAAAPFTDRLLLFGDNIVVPASSLPEANAILHALRSMLENSPAGPLTIGEHSIQSTARRVTVPGYTLRRAPAAFGGGWRVAPSARSYERLELRVMERVRRGHNLEAVEAYLRAWTNAFRQWRPNSLALLYLRLTAKTAAFRAGGFWQR